MALPKNFYKIYKERLAAEEQITYLPKGKQSAIPPHQQPRYQVLEVKLQGKDDQPIIISGNEVSIPQQLSLLKALDMLAQYRGWGSGGGNSEVMQPGGMVRRRGQPQVILYFIEDQEDLEEGYEAIKGRISFRLMDKTDDPDSEKPKLSKLDVEKLANKIKSTFYLPTPYEWKKGKEMCCYHHWELGYQLQLLCRNEATALDLTQKILSLQSHTFLAKNFNHTVTKDENGAYPTVPRTITVLGQQVREPRKRPVGTVRFAYATLLLQTLANPITLVDFRGDILPGSIIL